MTDVQFNIQKNDLAGFFRPETIEKLRTDEIIYFDKKLKRHLLTKHGIRIRESLMEEIEIDIKRKIEDFDNIMVYDSFCNKINIYQLHTLLRGECLDGKFYSENETKNIVNTLKNGQELKLLFTESQKQQLEKIRKYPYTCSNCFENIKDYVDKKPDILNYHTYESYHKEHETECHYANVWARAFAYDPIKRMMENF